MSGSIAPEPSDAAERTTGVHVRTGAALRPVTIPPGLRGQDLLERVPEEMWRRVLSRCGATIPIEAGALFHASLFRALVEVQPSLLVDALECLSTLGTPDGIEQLQRFAEDIEWALPPGLQLVGDVGECALSLWLMATEDAAIEEHLTWLRSVVLARQAKRASHRFVGREPRAARWTKQTRTSLQHALGRVFEKRGATSYAEIHRSPEQDLLRLFVLHAGSLRSVVSVDDTFSRYVAQFRPVASDIVTYDAETGRLTLQLSSAHLARHYVRVIGGVLFGDEEFFADGGWRLHRLQEVGPRVFTENRPPLSPVREVSVTSLVWEPRSGDRYTLSGLDVFEMISRDDLRIAQGEVLEAKLRVTFHGERRVRNTTVVIKPPTTMLCDERHRAAVEQYLEEVGLYVRDVEPRHDLWWAGDEVHEPSTWARVLGMAASDAAQAGLLVAAERAHVPRTPSALDPERAAVRVEVDGSARAVSHDGDIRLMDDEERRGMRLDRFALARRIANDLGLGASPTVVAPELYDLGVAVIGTIGVRLLFAHLQPGMPTSTLIDLARPGPAHRAAVLVPAGRDLPGVITIPIDSLFARVRLGAVVERLGLQDEVEAMVYAPATARLVIDMRREKVWLDGVEVTVPDIAFARRAAEDTLRKQSTPPKHLAPSVGPHLGSEGAGRQMKFQLMKAFRDAFKASGRSPPEEVATGKLLVSRGRDKGYVFSITPFMR